MIPTGVTEVLFNSIKELTDLEPLAEFNLGGGTNLAIKYNHRVSTDIDLFSQGVVGYESMKGIALTIENKYSPEYISLLNQNHDNLCFAPTILPGSWIKVEIIQNLKNLLPPELIQGGTAYSR